MPKLSPALFIAIVAIWLNSLEGLPQSEQIIARTINI